MRSYTLALAVVWLLSDVVLGQRTAAISSCTSSNQEENSCHEAFDGVTTGNDNGWGFKGADSAWGYFQLAEASDVTGVSIISSRNTRRIMDFSIQCYQEDHFVDVTNVRLISGQEASITGNRIVMRATHRDIQVDFDPVPGCTGVKLWVFSTNHSKKKLLLTELSILRGTIFSQVAAPGACLRTIVDDIGEVFGNSRHTIQVWLNFPDYSAPTSDQMILSLGDFQQDYSWIWKPGGIKMNGMGEQDLTHCTYLTTTFNGNKLRLYCNGIKLKGKWMDLSIDSPKLSIGTYEDEEWTQEDFAGCISKVVILSYKAETEEVSKGYQHNPPATKKYFIGNLGSTCPTDQLISNQEECETAMRALGLVNPFIHWSGDNRRIPAYCSYRPDSTHCTHSNCASHPNKGHWNTNTRNQGRVDLQPICKAGFLKNCHWEETKDDYLAKTAAYIGWTCASNEILTGFELQASEDDVTKVQCCELGGHSSVVPDSCIFTDLADPEFFQPEYASCNANEHMVFSGAYDKREEAGDAYTEVKVGRCCEVECDTPWCAGKDWGVNTELCYTISKDPFNDGVQELVCPKGTLMTQIHDGHQGQAHGIQRVESVVCCALDLIEKPTKAPTKRPTDSPSPSPTPAPSPSPSRSPTPSPTDAPSVAPTTKGDCLLALRCSTDMTDAEWVSAIEECCGNTAYYRRALKGRLLPEEAERM